MVVASFFEFGCSKQEGILSPVNEKKTASRRQENGAITNFTNTSAIC